MIKKRKTYLIICPKNKQFKNIIACAAGCPEHLSCKEYRLRVRLEILELFVAKHPEYEIIGEIMPVKKTTKKENEKTFWIVKDDKTVTEVSESEVIKNPQKYIDKEIWEKPPYKYQVVISLKRIKA